jgi:hypothetical protein
MDPDLKTRHAVQMACAARALAAAAPSDHLKRVLARYVFVFLHDVLRFAPAWRNQLLKDEARRATAEAAAAALERLRVDWKHYQGIRHFLGAKRQLRDPADAAADQLETFRLWTDIGALSVETLVDDAIELYVQLAALERLPPIDAEPEVSAAAVQALGSAEPLGDEAYLEVNAATFATARPRTVALRQGGHVGRLVALVNDVAESAAVLAGLAEVDDLHPAIRRLVVCELPSEISELMRLTIGPVTVDGEDAPADPSLLAWYREHDRPPDALTVLAYLESSIPVQMRVQLRDWRNRLGAHIDDATPWSVLEEGLSDPDLGPSVHHLRWLELQLEHAAVTAGGPALLLLGTRQFKSLFEAATYEVELSYNGAGATDPGQLRSALPPPEVDDEHVIWVGGALGSKLAPAVAGMLAGRARAVNERLKAWNADAKQHRRAQGL